MPTGTSALTTGPLHLQYPLHRTPGWARNCLDTKLSFLLLNKHFPTPHLYEAVQAWQLGTKQLTWACAWGVLVCAWQGGTKSRLSLGQSQLSFSQSLPVRNMEGYYHVTPGYIL